MLSIPPFILVDLTEDSKTRRIYRLFRKSGSHFSSRFYFFFFFQGTTPRKNYMTMYLRSSTLIQKQVSQNILSFAIGITFLVLMFQIFTRNLLLKIKALSLHISTEN
jgi:hypothetical protein